jgi:hypothetical protein
LDAAAGRIVQLFMNTLSLTEMQFSLRQVKFDKLFDEKYEMNSYDTNFDLK